ncbi:MAG: septum site-determining protein MinC [Caldilineaceae bacterium]|nr:septum site-determining protein MinC [Caldilineaceae bacterium]
MMSPTKELGPQSNPEQEPGAQGETLSTQRSARPLAVPLDSVPLDGVQKDESNGSGKGHGEEQNGSNGVHHHGDAPPVELSGDGANKAAPEAGPAAAEDVPAADEAPVLTDGMTTPRSAVKIKGRPGGVSLELGEGDWDELIHLLADRLNAAEGFFRGGRVVLDVGPRPLVEEQLRQVRNLLEFHEMQLTIVRSTAERTLQAAMEVGVSTSSEDQHEPQHAPEPPLIVPDGPPNAYTPSPYVTPEALPNRPNHFVHRGNLRSGQVLRKTESIVVIGDVNPGAQVISGGDIMVWGRLRGVAHAGADGNRRAVVTAIDFVPTQLRIANLTAIAPEQKKGRGVGLLFWKKEPDRRPEIARVIDGRIVVEPWDEGKPNGLGVWRK